MTKPNTSASTRYELTKRQAEKTKDIVADAIAGRKFGFLRDQGGPAVQPQSLNGGEYSGYNAVAAEAHAISLGSDSMQFGTASQFKKLGFRVRTGEKGVSMVGTTKYAFEIAYDKETGLPKVDKDARMVRELVELPKAVPTNYVVYNAAQMEAIDPEQKPELPAPKKGKRDTHPRETALRLAADLNIPIRRAAGRFTRADAQGIEMPPSEAIGNKSEEARHVVLGIAQHLHESKTLTSSSYRFEWKQPLVKAITAHRVGQQLGFGSQALSFSKDHLKSIANMVRQNPQRLVQAMRDARERADFMTNGDRRTALRDATKRRVQRMTQGRGVSAPSRGKARGGRGR